MKTHRTRLWITAAALGAAASFASVAAADVAPPTYVETCTVAKKEQPGTTCVECASSYEDYGDDSSGDHVSCDEQYAGTDYTHVCSTRGASFWTEVWCDGPPREGCSVSPGSAASPWAVLVTGGLLALTAWTARRRR